MAYGGGGGGYGNSAIAQTITVTPGEVLTIFVGTGGQGSDLIDGANGTNTSIKFKNGNTVVALGGAGGTASSTTNTVGNAGGVRSDSLSAYGAGGTGGTVGGSNGQDGTNGYASITWG